MFSLYTVLLTHIDVSTGHKMNHSFRSNCTEWFMDHPRFGMIPCERTTKFVKAGEELFLDYEYDPYNCPEWFKHALEDFVRDASQEDLEQMNSKYKKYVEYEILDDKH